VSKPGDRRENAQMASDDGDFTDPASRAGWGKAPARATAPAEAPAPFRRRRAPQAGAARDVSPGAIAILAGIAAGLTWWVFADWNAAPAVPGLTGFSIGRILMPAFDVALFLWFAMRVVAGAEATQRVSLTAVRVGLLVLLAGSAALEGTGVLRRAVLQEFGRVPGGPTWEQAMDEQKRQHARQFAAWLGAAQEPAFFEGNWRRNDRMYRNDVRRIAVRRDGDGLRVRIWHECEPGKAPCDAGEVPAVLTRGTDGRIASITAEVVISDGSIWFMMGPGKAAHQPGVIVTQVLMPERPEKQVSSGMGATLAREKPAAPLREFVGDWSRPMPRDIGDFTRLSVREAGARGLAVRAWSLCEARRECDLGEQPAQVETEADGRVRTAQASFQSPKRVLVVVLEPPVAGRFEAESQNLLYRDTSGGSSRNRSTSWSTLTRRTVLTRGHPATPVAGEGGAPAPAAASTAANPVATSCASARALHQAIALGCGDVLRGLVTAQGTQLEARNGDGQTPLALAVLRNQHGAAETLLKAGADANALVSFAAGSRPNASGLQRAQRPELAEGSTPLMLARDAAMAALLLRFGADTKPKNDYGWSALFYYTHHGSVEMLDILLGAGAAINDTADVDPSHAGTTPLMWAAYMNRTAHLQTLLKYKPRLDLRDRAGKTALDYARGFGHQESIRLLTAARS
jgi:hypothetical protein